MISLPSSTPKATASHILEPWDGVIWPAPTIAWIEQWLLRVLLTPVMVIISPHADDAEIACAALIAWATSRAIRVVEILVFPGFRSSTPSFQNLQPEEIVALRVQENERACVITGAELHYLGLNAAYGRKHYQPDQGEIRRLAAVLRRLRPSVVFVPPRHDPHGAHQAARAILARALQYAGLGRVEILSFDGAWGGLGGAYSPNLAFRYGSTLATVKKSANLAFQTQLVPTNIAELAEVKDHLAALRLPELVAGHHSVSSELHDGFVGAELFRRETPDPAQADGEWADPLQKVLLDGKYDSHDLDH
jgi:LmbE family N-acetylglucosaminyl deacetylase